MPRTPVGRSKRRNIDVSRRPVPELIDVQLSNVVGNVFQLGCTYFTGNTIEGDLVPVVLKGVPALAFEPVRTIVSAVVLAPGLIEITLNATTVGTVLTIPPYVPQIRSTSGGYLAPRRAMSLE